MRVWIDLANSPHVSLFAPVVDELQRRGADVVLTARDHAQTVELARDRWPDVEVVGTESPGKTLVKGTALGRRAVQLTRTGRRLTPDVALSHGSYAQLAAAAALRIRSVTMMDYEFQPANHLSFRLARTVIVPSVFPGDRLRRFGASHAKVRRYTGFKEELYLAGFRPSGSTLSALGIAQGSRVLVLRPPPTGALYHPDANRRFDPVVEEARARPDITTVLLPRGRRQRDRYSTLAGLVVPPRAVDGLSLVALADAVIGAGGTMNREAALLGTPTYTLFAGRLAAVDARLVELGYMHDLRAGNGLPSIEPRGSQTPHVDQQRAAELLELVVSSVLSP